MNTIVSLQAQVAAKDAELQSLHAGIAVLIGYLQSDKFAPGTGDLAGYVNVDDIVIRLRETESNASLALYSAYANELGPRIADGSHTGCTHGTYAGVPRVNGYHCPTCGTALPGQWNDTESRAAERMRQHWVATHRVA